MKKSILTVALIILCNTWSLMSKELIEVSTSQTSMVFSAETGAPIKFNYWGERINNITPCAINAEPNQPDVSNRYTNEIYPAYGGRYFLNPALQLTHSDGILTTELIYKSHRAEKIDDNTTRTTIVLRDNIYPITVTLTLTAYIREDIISQQVQVENNEKGEIVVNQIASGFVPLHSSSYYLTHFNGSWGYEMQMAEEKLLQGTKTIESKKGIRATLSENPSFMISMGHPACETEGEVYAGALAWSGNYRFDFVVDEQKSLNISAGINPFASAIHLKKGEKFTSPALILGYSSTGRGQISRNFHRWARKYSMAHGDTDNSILLNSWEGAYFNFDEKTLTDMIDDAAAIGIERFVLDDGWFGNQYPRNSSQAGLGDWQVNSSKLPRGISYLADYAVSKGVKFGIWIEPEMVNPESNLAKQHPEWIVKSGNRDKPQMRDQWVLDLTNPKVQDFVFKTFDEVVSLSPNITYIKWDANRWIENVGSTYLAPDKQTHFWTSYINGLYSVYERIRAKYPNIEIQACSSGGGRVDFGSLRYHDEVWTSDNTNPLTRIYIQYGTSMFYPSMAMSAHVCSSPNHQTGMSSPLKYRFDVAMSGRLGIELQPKQLNKDEYEYAKSAIAAYKTIRPIVQRGDLYRLLSPYDEGGWSSLMYVSDDKSEAVFFAYSTRLHGFTEFFSTKLQGLDPDKTYLLSEINPKPGVDVSKVKPQVYTGDYLMKRGIKLDIGAPFDSRVLRLKEQKN